MVKKLFYKQKGCMMPKKMQIIMKISFALTALLAFTITTNASVFSQPNNVSLELKSQSLSSALVQFRDVTGVQILFNENAMQNVMCPDISLQDTPAEKALEMILKNTGFEFNEVNGVYVVTQPPQQAQQRRTVSGVVTDEFGNPFPGVSVIVKGTRTGEATDADGKYQIQYDPQYTTLEVTFIGYKKMEIVIGNRSVIDIRLEPDAYYVDDVVVTGYQTLPKERVTGSFAKITPEQLDQTLSYSIVDKIESISTGVLFDPLGITIRGVSTLNANRMPLIVVDDFPISIDDVNNDGELAGLYRTLESINPNNVASVTILKDAAAASIWGVRASNGVIVITTKRTSSREPEIDFSSNFMFSAKPDVGKLPFAAPATYLEMEMERYNAGWTDQWIANMNMAYFLMSDVILYNALFKQGICTQAELDAALQRAGTLDNRNEFSDLFLRGKSQQQYNLSIRQNTPFNNYALSLSYDKVNSIYKQTDNDRVTLNFQNTFKPSDYVQAGVALFTTMRKENNNGITLENLFASFPYEHFLDNEGNYTHMNNPTSSMMGASYFREAFYEAHKDYLPYDWNYNLKREFDNKNNTTVSTDIRVQGNITVKPFGNEELKIMAHYQYERSHIETNIIQNEETFYVRNLVNNFAQTNKTYPVPKGAIFDQEYGYNYSHTLRFTANYIKKVRNRHQFALYGGMEIQENSIENSLNRRYGFDEQAQTWATQMDLQTNYARNFYPSNAYSIESSYNSTQNYYTNMDRFLSYFGNGSYTFDDKYDITGSFRLDKSNMYGRTKQYREVPLWSVGAGWLISNERFFNVSWIDRLRLRATYGANGNVDKSTSPQPIATLMNNGIIGLPGAVIVNPANPLLSWEKTLVGDFGVDFFLLNNRIYGTVEYFHKRSIDVLASQPMNVTLGYSSAKINTGEILNTGIEIDISLTPIRTNRFTWDSRIAYSYVKNEVVSGGSDVRTLPVSYLLGVDYDEYRTQPGMPRFYLNGLEWAGLDERGYPQIYRYDPDSPNNKKLLKYDDPYVELRFEDLVYMGAKQAPHFGSWTNTFNYRGFNFSCMLQYKFGHVYKHTSPVEVPNNDLFGLQQGNSIQRYHIEWRDRWKKPGDENFTDIPRLPTETHKSEAPIASSYYSDMLKYRNVQFAKADHIRLSRISLSYKIPNSVLPKAVKNLVLTVQAANVGYIAFNKWHEDPERVPDMYGNSLTRAVPEYTFNIKLQL